MELVLAGRDGVTSCEVVLVDRVPVEEQVGDRAALLSQVRREELHLRDRETIVAEPNVANKIISKAEINHLLEGLNILCRWQAEEGDAERGLVEPILVEVEGDNLTLRLLIHALINNGAVRCRLNWSVGGFAQARVRLDAKHADKCLHILEESARRLEWLHVNRFSPHLLIIFVGPNVLHFV